MRWFRDLKIRYIFLLAVLPVNIAATAAYTAYLYQEGAAAVIRNMDDRLLSAAYGARFLTDPHHDRMVDNASISADEYRNIVRLFTEFSENIAVEYLYAVVLEGERMLFTADSTTSAALEAGAYPDFLAEYPDPGGGLMRAATQRRIHFDQYTDQWGGHRSVFVPFTSPGGTDYVVGVDMSLDYVDARLKAARFHALLVGLVVLLAGSGAVVLIAAALTRPLRALTRATTAMATGDLEIELPAVGAGAELKALTQAFGHMASSLKEHIRELTEATAARARTDSELRIAHDIQMSILPATFPPFAGRRNAFKLFALIEPAREVGGDFYDFFYLDEAHFCFVIGDVSGKGVPAALFMAVTKTLIKSTAPSELDAGRILTRVNAELSEANDTCMFVTVFIGILDVASGEVRYACGGHNPPLLMRADCRATALAVPKDLVVGPMAGYQYQSCSIMLQPGDGIFMYTDGVTEAMNEQLALFSETRLQAELDAMANETADVVLARTMEAVALFVGDAPRSDDITMMMIRYTGE